MLCYLEQTGVRQHAIIRPGGGAGKGVSPSPAFGVLLIQIKDAPISVR